MNLSMVLAALALVAQPQKTVEQGGFLRSVRGDTRGVAGGVNCAPLE